MTHVIFQSRHCDLGVTKYGRSREEGGCLPSVYDAQDCRIAGRFFKVKKKKNGVRAR